jgi:uncharacterized protein YndB with AHSA1/START domain
MKKEILTQDAVYPHPVQRVWTALTKSSELALWLLPNDFAARVGHRFTFTSNGGQGWSGIVECEVVEVVPYRRLSYTWYADPRSPAMLITFTLEQVAGGTHLHLEQTAHSTIGWQAELIREALPSLHLSLGGPPTMSRFFRIMVDAEALTNALFEFVTDPYAPSRNERPVVQELHTFAPEMIAVLENMILDGVNERRYIDEYIYAIFGSMNV